MRRRKVAPPKWALRQGACHASHTRHSVVERDGEAFDDKQESAFDPRSPVSLPTSS